MTLTEDTRWGAANTGIWRYLVAWSTQGVPWSSQTNIENTVRDTEGTGEGICGKTASSLKSMKSCRFHHINQIPREYYHPTKPLAIPPQPFTSDAPQSYCSPLCSYIITMNPQHLGINISVTLSILLSIRLICDTAEKDVYVYNRMQ